MQVVGELLLLLGALLFVLAGIGLTRFRATLTRMHSLSKASTLGMLLVLGGGFLIVDTANARTFLVVTAILQVLASPVSAIVISRATYRAANIPNRLDASDDLAGRDQS